MRFVYLDKVKFLLVNSYLDYFDKTYRLLCSHSWSRKCSHSLNWIKIKFKGYSIWRMK